MKTSTEYALLLQADTSTSADMRYLAETTIPDPFTAIVWQGRKIAVLSALEFDRVRRNSAFDEILPLEILSAQARKTYKGHKTGPAEIIRLLAAEYKIPGFSIPPRFPSALAFALREARVRLRIAKGGLFPAREFKSDSEAAEIARGNAASSAGFRRVEQILRYSTVKNGYIVFQGRRLTSEFLQSEIAKVCLDKGSIASHTIVAGGDQACDPHEAGYGPLRANRLIIVDIFPRIVRTGYHGDMTRTYLKGRPSTAQQDLVATVFQAQQSALKAIKAGRSGRKLWHDTLEFFEKNGFNTEKTDRGHIGFFHGLGHGLGLEVHEPPRLGQQGTRLKANQVVTVEPGLYYPGLGGCRIEDVVRVKSNGCEMLSKHPYKWHFL